MPPTSELRRDFLLGGAYGFGATALWHLLASTGSAEPTPHFSPRAKQVIFIFMMGGPSHVDLFDPKPKLTELHGQPLPPSLVVANSIPTRAAGGRPTSRIACQLKSGTLESNTRATPLVGAVGMVWVTSTPLRTVAWR